MVRRKDIRPPWIDPKLHFRRKLTRFFVHFFGWIGIAVLYYIAFSFLFDTPLEFRMKASTGQLRKEYNALSARFDTISDVLDNVIERDRNVFRILFESEPYDLDDRYNANRWEMYEKLLEKREKELGRELVASTQKLEKMYGEVVRSYENMETKLFDNASSLNYIPAVQPVINKNLTLLTASFGLRIHPFYKSLAPHMGVDYTVPEGSRVFATADGRVKDVVQRRSSSGLSVVINHGNGYETTYSHLGRINVRSGQEVKRGDIIAWSGNTGLSLAPHLHYEVKHNGMRVDPVHYFFMELSPLDYQRMMKIARSGMQSFD